MPRPRPRRPTWHHPPPCSRDSDALPDPDADVPSFSPACHGNSLPNTDIDLAWRALLQGHSHTTLSLFIHRHYLHVLRIAADAGIITLQKRGDWDVGPKDALDLSVTTRHFTSKRFRSLLGPDRAITLRQIGMLLKERRSFEKAGLSQAAALRLELQTHETANACHMLLAGRHLDAHAKQPIGDAGLALSLAGATLRVLEMLDRPKGLSEVEVERTRAAARHLARLAVGYHEPPQTASAAPVDRLGRLEAGFARLSGLVEDVLRGHHHQARSDKAARTEPPDLPLTTEQARQALLTLRDRIAREAAANGSPLKPGQNILQRRVIDTLLQSKSHHPLADLVRTHCRYRQNQQVLEAQLARHSTTVWGILARVSAGPAAEPAHPLPGGHDPRAEISPKSPNKRRKVQASEDARV